MDTAEALFVYSVLQREKNINKIADLFGFVYGLHPADSTEHHVTFLRTIPQGKILGDAIRMEKLFLPK